jgi:hypothetical protein
MLRKISLATAALTALTAMPAAADAQPNGRAWGYWNRSAHARPYDDRAYYSQGYSNPYYGGRYDQRYAPAQRCNSGTTGTILGAVAGGLLGREVAGRYGDRTMGAVVGGAAGALAGRALTRNRNC